MGGDGGAVEVSGNYLDFQGTVNTTAPHGAAGTLLLDPTDLTISSAADANVGSGPTSYSPQTAAVSNLSTATLVGALANNDVTVTTNGSPDYLSESGNITVSNAISWSSTHSLTLQAMTTGGGAVLVNAAITDTGSGGVTLDAGTGGITLAAGITTAGGTITLSGAATLSTNVGLDTTNGGAGTARAAISLAAVAGGGNTFALNAGTGGAITVRAR